MRKFLFTALLAVAATSPVLTASAKTLTAQQQKMSDCNAQATTQSLKGQPRKDFMKTCLSAAGTPAGAPTQVPAADPAAAAPGAPAAAAPAALPAKQTQQEKMKSCNADATSKSLKGDDRKSYMKTCLSGSPA